MSIETTTKDPKPAEVFDVEGGPGEQSLSALPVTAGAARPLTRVPEPPRYSLIETSEEVSALLTALVEATLKFTQPEFDATGNIQSRKGEASSYKYRYATLSEVNAAVRKPLAEAGLVITHGAKPGQSTLMVRTVLWHKTGQWMRTDLPVGLYGTDPKEIGAAISYAKRYNILALLNLSPGEDDDEDQLAKAAPIVPAQRKSQQPAVEVKAPVQPVAPAPAQAPAAPAQPQIGLIVETGVRDGIYAARLDTGFRCGTRDKALGEALRSFADRGQRVELRCKPPSKPNYLPAVIEIAIIN